MVARFVPIFAVCLFCLTQAAQGMQLHGRVIKVSDGDTVWVLLDNGRKVKIRVWGIDTPEKFSSKKLKRDAERCRVSAREMRKLGEESSRVAKRLLFKKKVTVIPVGRGVYGRLLAKIYVDGRDYGYEIIRRGYSCVYRKSHRKYEEAYRYAVENRLGLTTNETFRCLCEPGRFSSRDAVGLLESLMRGFLLKD